MPEIIKKNSDIILILGIGLVLTLGGLLNLVGITILPEFASAATSQQSVAISVTVQEWLTFSLSTSSVTLLPDLVDSSGNTNIASSSVIDMNLGTNSADGWSISATSTNGALVSAGNSIDSPAAGNTTTTATGTDAYGINATTTYSTINIPALYAEATLDSNVVGSVDTTSQTFATSSAKFSSGTNVIDTRIRASCDAAQPSGTYQDTIYFTAISSIP